MRPSSLRKYEVTVSNLTRGQRFTPILVASHKGGVSNFTLGDSASSQLAFLAEDGGTGPLTTLLLGMPEVKEQSKPRSPGDGARESDWRGNWRSPRVHGTGHGAAPFAACSFRRKGG
ncbi:MAG: spondin domain-containing protein [Candidatus Methylomirabilales bacterium]